MNFIKTLAEKLKRQGNSSSDEQALFKNFEHTPASSAEHDKITLVSKRWSVGMAFIFEGATPKCKGCRIIGACANLEKGRLYAIKAMKEIEHQCQLTNEEVVTTYVNEPNTLIAIPKMTFEGANITYNSDDIPCGNHVCENRELCFPSYYKNGDTLKVLKKHGTLEKCEETSTDLTVVEVIRVQNN